MNALPSPAGWSAALLALAAGAALPLAFAPFGAWPLTLLCPAVLLLCWQGATVAQAAWRGWLFGLGLFGSGTSWVFVSIHTYGAASVPLAALLTVLFCAGLALFQAAQGALFAHLQAGRRSDALLLFPLLWLLVEWVRGWLLTGFPWLYLGTPHTGSWLAGWAPLLGVLALSGLCALCSGLLLEALRQPRQAWRPLAGMALVFASGLLLAQVRWVQPQPALRVALVQGNMPQQLKWDPAWRDEALQRHARLTEPYWGAELVVWPEAALPLFLDEAGDWLGRQEQHAQASGSTLLTGIPTRERDGSGRWRYHNSLTALGNGLGTYHKQKLVPFGEYVPLESLLRGLIAFFDLPMSDFARGPTHQPPLQAGRWAIAPLICYEIAYPDFTARRAQPANLIVTVSNDTWFGRSTGPHQHLEMARLRALETGRPVLRATNNGVTAIIDHQGRITARLPQFDSGVLAGTVQPTTGQTLFDIWGSWPLVMLSVLGLLRLWHQYRRR